jgi:hypothetical protein
MQNTVKWKTRLISNLYHCTVFFCFYQQFGRKNIFICNDLLKTPIDFTITGSL